MLLGTKAKSSSFSRTEKRVRGEGNTQLMLRYSSAHVPYLHSPAGHRAYITHTHKSSGQKPGAVTDSRHAENLGGEGLTWVEAAQFKESASYTRVIYPYQGGS